MLAYWFPKKHAMFIRRGIWEREWGVKQKWFLLLWQNLKWQKKFNFMPYDLEFLPLRKAKKQNCKKDFKWQSFSNFPFFKSHLQADIFCHFTVCNNRRNGFRRARPFLFFLFIEFLSHKLPQFSKLFSIICAAVSSI